MQIDQERLKSENTNLVAAFREKNRKHQQTQELYDRLKRREMTAVTQSAAFDSVDEVLGNVSSQQRYSNPQHNSSIPRSQAQSGLGSTNVDHNGIERTHSRQEIACANCGGNADMMPPPIPRRIGLNRNGLGHSEL